MSVSKFYRIRRWIISKLQGTDCWVLGANFNIFKRDGEIILTVGSRDSLPENRSLLFKKKIEDIKDIEEYKNIEDLPKIKFMA